MDLSSIQKAYARWAPHYDLSFGVISDWGRNFVVSQINQKPGRVLEVGVGTGLALPMYAPDMLVTGIDISDTMLERAKKRVEEEKIRHVEGLHNMDATDMDFADEYFDTIVAMYIMSVAPNPEAILNEMVRTVKKGGDIYILNHFSSKNFALKIVEKVSAPICRIIGWHSTFDMNRLLGHPELELVDIQEMRPLGLFHKLHFKKK